MKCNCTSCNGSGVGVHFTTGTNLPCSWCNGSGFGTWRSDNIVCPYCGEEHDYQEIEVYGEVELEIECGVCEREFEVSGTLTQTFDTRKIK